MVEIYTKVQPANPCWWHSERSNVGILSAAAWKTPGWVALEEYPTEKHGKLEKNGKQRESYKYGRCDLYLSHTKCDFALEAKQAWQRVSDRAKPLGETLGRINSAWKDTGSLQNSEAKIRIAATFVIPIVNLGRNKAKSKEAVTELIDKWITTLVDSKEIKWDALAWTFPVKARTNNNGDNNYFPGIVLILRERKKSRISTQK